MGFFEGHKLKNKSGELVNAVEALKNKVILVYFSAHWCPPCRMFTPTLKDCYEELVEEGCQIGIVFVSSDRSEDDMNSYFQGHHGDWFVVPFGDKELIDSLKKECKVSGIPKLVVVDENGRMLYDGARNDVQATSPKLAFKKWKELYEA
ncbi:nucleoredoxin-like protein 2 [Actinia tenebrosa]|uniref:Nucleoredoxin-like protein 2 n=1 Tax=Actinia tenebrosa TaxID=6105 RepID=A0A6P8IE83_ACTTE|nr:nucleoredoxin-like protein 2 [Actinia tenebrosa]